MNENEENKNLNDEIKSDEVNKNEENLESKIEEKIVDEDNSNKNDSNVELLQSDNEDKVTRTGSKNEEKYKKSEISAVKKTKNSKKVVVIICVVLAIFGILIGAYSCFVKMYTGVFKNVYLLDENMSFKSEEDVIKYVTELDQKFQENLSNEENGIDIYQGTENIYKVFASDFEIKINIAKTAQNIMNYGRENGILKNDIDVLVAMFSKRNVDIVFDINNSKLEETLKNVELTLKNRFVDDKYTLDEKDAKLIITRGTTGNTIDLDTEKEKLINICKNNMIYNKHESLKLDIKSKKPTELDLNKLYNEVKKDAKDAYIDETKTPIELVKEEVGYDFNVEDLKNLLEKEGNQDEGKTIYFSLTVIEPKVKLSDITYKLYRDKLAGYTTYFTPGVYARSTNLKIALSYLNDIVIMPGETFSYNAAVGDVSAAQGYQAAAVFKGGTTVNEIGGGICQTTSTLYNVALMANLQIVERYQHGLPVGYVPPSRDATVYSPSLDFKFKNTRKYPVKIVTSFSYDGSLNISLYGTKEEEEYEVILSSTYLKTINYTTRYIYDESLPEGESIVVSKGVNGYQSEGYITKKLNGKVVSSSLLSRDTYNAQQEVIKIGTKKSE